MALKLYGHPQSICTKRVRTVLEEKKLQYEFIVVDLLKGEQLSEPYGVELHPFKQIPVLVDEESDAKVFKSRAIAYYIAAKYRDSGPDLSPSEADVKTVIAWEAIFKPMLGYGAGDEAAIKAKIAALDTALAGYEHILSRQSYLVGDEITLADVFHLPYGSLVQQAGFGELLLKYPSVEAWWKRLQERDSWNKVDASE
ncbi:Glutathione S-transferase [Fusarium oxysporum f. sp. rapae]|uniref:glutathione transferase n=1 Tax=Fusarium oxysporum f. sp. rapae TaxID=485398 RepID=A0A8J5NQZ1_FUSOX|nr:Glutathione S-transferase [Fusarium oxysporum f. sp. rapae]